MKSAVLRKLPTFGMLDDEALQAVAEATQTRELAKGQTLFEAGHGGAEFFVVLWGGIRLFATSESGGVITLAVLGGGEPFGEMALFEEAPRSASAVALEDSELLVLHRDAFTRVLRAHPDMAVGMLRMLARRLRQANRDLLAMANFDVLGRLTHRLVDLAQSRGTETSAGLLIDLPLDKETLAGMIGAEPGLVEQLLKGLVHDRHIAWRYEKLVINDLATLSALARLQAPQGCK